MPKDKKWYKSKTIWTSILLVIVVAAWETGYISPMYLDKIFAVLGALGLYGVRDAIGKIIDREPKD